MVKSIFANTQVMEHPATRDVRVWHAKQLEEQSAGKESVKKGIRWRQKFLGRKTGHIFRKGQKKKQEEDNDLT